MPEEDLGCTESLSTKDAIVAAHSSVHSPTPPPATPRKVRRFEGHAAAFAKDEEALNRPAFAIACDKPDETHVQHRLLREFLEAREGEGGGATAS
jgi:hypothetical protein